MKELNLTELYALYKDTLSHLGTFLLTETKEDVEYHVFEEFDSDSVSFFHETNLRALWEGGLISAEICETALRLAADFRALEGTALWNPEAVVSAEAWRKVLELGDAARRMVEAHESSHGRTDA